MSEKINDIANGDLLSLSASIDKIAAATVSTYSHLDHLANIPREEKSDVLYMLDIIKDLSDKANNDLAEITEKLCKLSHEIA